MLDVRWAPLRAAATAAQQPMARFYSLSADATLLLWPSLPLPLADLFPATSGSKHGGGGGSSAGRALQAGRLAAPLDVGAQLGAAFEPGTFPEAAACLGGGTQRPWLTAFALPPPDSLPALLGPEADPCAGSSGCGAGRHLLAVASKGGTLVVLLATHAPAATTAAAAAAGEVILRTLWAVGGGGTATASDTVRWPLQGPLQGP